MELKIGETIKRLRKKQGRTQENLANALGITFQAVSRWESGLAYPDMELVPSIANYFGVSIDELFGFENQRQDRVDKLVEKIQKMDLKNNGTDACIDECIQLARKGLIEFPGNQTLMLCLANLLCNAGYARYGEHHLLDADGYDVFDIERHQKYAEWQESKVLYEKLVMELEDGAQKQETVLHLTQLYALTGETEKSMKLIETLPDISGSKDLLILNACGGKKRAEAYGKSLSKLLRVSANLMCTSVVASNGHITNEEAVNRIQNGIRVLEMDPLGHPEALDDHLTYHGITGVYLYLSTFLWRAGDYDGAFATLDKAYEAAREKHTAAELPDYWPCWCVPDCSDVAGKMKADPRWGQWVKKCSSET